MDNFSLKNHAAGVMSICTGVYSRYKAYLICCHLAMKEGRLDSCARNCSRCLSPLHCGHMLQTIAGASHPSIGVNVLQIVPGASHPSTASTCTTNCSMCLCPSTASTCTTNCSRCLSILQCRYMRYKLRQMPLNRPQG